MWCRPPSAQGPVPLPLASVAGRTVRWVAPSRHERLPTPGSPSSEPVPSRPAPANSQSGRVCADGGLRYAISVIPKTVFTASAKILLMDYETAEMAGVFLVFIFGPCTLRCMLILLLFPKQINKPKKLNKIINYTK